jgi:transposase-like protein
MTRPIVRDPIYRKRMFDAGIITLCVRRYISYKLSYRDLVEIMAERGIDVAHSTILRWVTRFVPEFEKRWDRYRRRVGGSWRVDETYVCVRGKWHSLYRAVDQHGQTVDFVLRKDRGVAAAQAFFRKALASNGNCFPRTVTLDGHRPSRSALWKLRMERVRWRHVKVRTCQYLNNIVEQDHRGIKARYGPMKCFKSFANAAITLAGLELAHRIRKHQFSFGRGYRFGRNRMRDWSIALV